MDQLKHRNQEETSILTDNCLLLIFDICHYGRGETSGEFVKLILRR